MLERFLWGRNRFNNCGGVIFQSLIEADEEEVLDLDDDRQFDCFLTETDK